jgi:hypothetical protein
MSDGPSRREIDRVREALERHDSELSEEPTAEPEEPDEDSDHQDDDR